MTDQNNNNDKYIRDLLKWRLLEQAGDDDLLTQKLRDMEAKLVFSNEALLQPSLQKEKELLQKLIQTKSKNKLLKWLLPSFLLVLISITFLFYNNSTSDSITVATNKENSHDQNNNLPTIQTHTIESTDSSNATVSTIVVQINNEELVAADTIKSVATEKWRISDERIKVDYKQSQPKKVTSYVDPYENIPVLSESQKIWTRKMKEKLVKGVIKLDKNIWVYIPTSSDVIYGDAVSVQGFYMLNMEVTNNTYRIFLNDLIIQDRFDDYLKAVPDTAKWMINNRPFMEPMRKNYFWHPAYDEFPVVNVSREGVKMFCVWLTQSVNEKIKATNSKEKAEALLINDIRIPAEEEWIIAARGGKGDFSYPWTYRTNRKDLQNSKGCYLCNFSIINYPDSLKNLAECSNDKLKNAITSAGTYSNDFYFTCKVNSYNPNDYGLYCICGNVSEMVWQYKTNKPCAKGGSWKSDAEQVKVSAEPELMDVTEGNPALGFRPVFTAKKIK